MILQAPAMDVDEALEAPFILDDNDLLILLSRGEEDFIALTNGISTDEENGDFCGRDDQDRDGGDEGNNVDKHADDDDGDGDEGAQAY